VTGHPATPGAGPGATPPVPLPGADPGATPPVPLPGGPEPTLLRVDGLAVHYPPSRAHRDRFGRGLPVRAVDGVSFAVDGGEILALVGESGSGKTTIAKSVLRLVEPTAGRILHRGRDITALRGAELRHLRARLQAIFQDPYESLDPRQTVEEIVTEPLVIHDRGGTPAGRRELVDEALAAAGLNPPAEIAGRYPHQLSGGQRQRVAIAAAMVLQPELVVADEPVSMLDVSLRAGILRLMLDLRDRRGFAYLFITHDLSLAWVFADRVAVVYLGRIVEVGPADSVIRRPLHPYTRSLVSVIPIPAPRVARRQLVLRGETPTPTAIPAGCRFAPRCWLRERLGNPDVCTSLDPALVAIEADHEAACHFATEEVP
jgi:peptide/nickel transport system ATP-binding protein/oligopeptide transport system ATP-binding protein